MQPVLSVLWNMDCVSQKNARESSSFEDRWFSFIAFSKQVCSSAETLGSFSQCLCFGKIWCPTITDFLKITFDNIDGTKLLFLIPSFFSPLSHLCPAWPMAWYGFAQVPGRIGCHQRSNRHRVGLYKLPGQGDHVSCVYKTALHRGRFPAGIGRRTKEFNSVANREGCLTRG